MSIQRSETIFLNGEWKPWDSATVHVAAHGLHYGSCAFEGIRAYETPHGTSVFRLREHVERLVDSARILRMTPLDYSTDELEQLCIEAVTRNGLDSCYIRPFFYRGAGALGLNPMDSPVEFALFAVEWGRYLGAEAIEQGVDVAISSWRRFSPSTASPLGKIGGQYVTNSFVSIEARENGFAEGIMLDQDGMVCEGAGENIFIVLDGTLITNHLASSILGGITRDSVLQIARDLDVPVSLQPISRDMLYVCDEMFMTGTAAEVSPVRSVDRIAVGAGSRGPITEALQTRFFDTVEGRAEDTHGWLTPVPKPAPAAAT
ncbi:MAG: branched-chain amino acid transaminase [Acidobacteriota bacterium]